MPERFNPYQPNTLPPELSDFLRRQDYAALLHGSNIGTIMVAKVLDSDFRTIGGRIPVSQLHELHDHVYSPVIRMVTTLHDIPSSPLKLETFVNVGDVDQRSDYDVLSRQDELVMLFYDQAVRHRLTKRVRNVDKVGISRVLGEADRLLGQIPEGFQNFDLAKMDIMRITDL